MPRLPLIRDSVPVPAARFKPIQIHADVPGILGSATLASRVVRTDIRFPLRAVAPLTGSVSGPAPAAGSMDEIRGIPAGSFPADFVGSGWLGQTLHAFECWHDAHGQRVLFDDGAAFWVSADGDHIRVNATADNCPHRDELLLGPALMLALGARGIFGLHASAILGAEGAVVLLGPSGSGKSSLARYAVSQGALRLSDDVTPLARLDIGMRVLPRFPQLKLAPILMVDDLELPLAALVWVEIGPDPLALTRMRDVEASRCLLRDTVAARLFEPEMLSRHLDFCADLAMCAPAWHLNVPRVEVEQQTRMLDQGYRLLRGLGLP